MSSPGAGEPATTPSDPTGGSASAPPRRSTPPGPIPSSSRSSGTRHSGHTSGGVGNVLSGDWPVQAADAIVKGVDTVRDKTTGPVQKAARAVVYGLLAVVLGTMVVILAIIGLVRLVDSLVGLFMDPPRIWVTYLIVGVVFTVAGVVVFRRRRTDLA